MVYKGIYLKILEKFDNLPTFCEKIGQSRQNVSNKLHGKTCFQYSDIVEWSNLLGIGKNEIAKYFF